MHARMVLVTLSLLAVPAPAEAVPQQVAVHSGGFLPSEVQLIQGDTLTLTNLDATQAHDLVSRARRSNGSRLFQSAVVGAAGQAEVVGVSALRPSVYPFLCSVHEWMVGNITVTAVAR